MEDYGNKIPKGWTKAVVSDLIAKGGLFCDGDWVETKDQEPSGEVRLIQLADLGDGYFKDKSERFLTYTKSKELKCTYLKNEDILIARLPDPLGRACIFPLTGENKFVTVVDICIVRPNTKLVNTKYLLYLINSPQIRLEIDKYKSGSTRKRISRKNLDKIKLFIAPLAEQYRIVVKIEELFSELDKGIESLKKAQEQLKVYCQAVLKHAFEGKLTEKWREQQLREGKLESAESLLEKIKQERERLYQEQLEQWEQSVKEWEANGKEGKKPAKPSKLKEIKLFNDEEIAELPKLPLGWIWVKLGQITSDIKIGPFGSLLHKSDYVLGQIPIVNPSHIKNGKIITDPTLTITVEKFKELCNYALHVDDIVFGRRGEMGRCAIVREKEKGYLCGTGSLLIRLIRGLNSNFYCSLLRSQRVKNYLENASIGTTMRNLNEDILYNIPVQLCQPIEQQEIFQQIESRLSICDQLEAEILINIEKAEALRQSILKRAFEGKLVPQNPNDEPAEKLLERIKNEKNKVTESLQQQLNLEDI